MSCRFVPARAAGGEAPVPQRPRRTASFLRTTRVLEAPWGPLAACALGSALTTAAVFWLHSSSRLAPSLPLVAVASSARPPERSSETHLDASPASQQLAWIRVTPDGTLERERATKADVCRRFSLPARDLRLFFDGSQNAALLGRERALLLRLRPSARAILSATEVFFPVADDVALAQAVSEHLKDHSTKRPFEMRVLDIALERECARLDLEAVHLEADAKLVLERLVARVSSEHLEMTRRLKGSVGRALGEATALANELGRFLDDDSDMRSLMLTAPSRPLREVEDLLETYAAQVNGCRSKLSLIDEAIADTETARPPTLLQSRNFRRSCSRAPHFTTYHSALTPPSLIRRAQFLSRDLDAKRNLYVGCNLTFSAAAFSERLWTALAKAAGGGKDKDREEN